MADAALLQLPVEWGPLSGTANPTSFINFTLDANNDALEFLLQAPKAMTVTRLGVRLGTITGTTPTYRVSAQGINSSGNPDGTIKGATNNAKKTFSPSGLGWSAGSFNWLTLDETFSLAAGDYFSIVIDYSSGTINGSNCASFTESWNTQVNAQNFPCSQENNATVRAKQPWGVAGVAWGSSTTVNGYPISAGTLQQINSASNPREVGFKFKIPSGWCSTFKLRGIKWLMGYNDAATQTFRLYDGGGASDTTVLQDVTLDTDVFNSTSGRPFVVCFDESTLATLNAGTFYRIGITTDNANDTNMWYWSVAAAGDFDAFPLQQDCYWTQRPSGGSWTDVTTQRPWATLILDDITAPAGGGGGLLLHPGMSGGIRG